VRGDSPEESMSGPRGTERKTKEARFVGLLQYMKIGIRRHEDVVKIM